MSDSPAFRADLARSARLLRAFGTEQASPVRYCVEPARDTIAQLRQYTELTGRGTENALPGGPGARGVRALAFGCFGGEFLRFVVQAGGDARELGGVMSLT